MTDGQFYMVIIGAETAVIAACWAVWRRIQVHRARTAWIRQLEARRRRQGRAA